MLSDIPVTGKSLFVRLVAYSVLAEALRAQRRPVFCKVSIIFIFLCALCATAREYLYIVSTAEIGHIEMATDIYSRRGAENAEVTRLFA